MKIQLSALALATLSLPILAQGADVPETSDFQEASVDVQRRLQESIEELTRVSEQITSEKVPLARQLNELERELSQVKSEFQETARQLDTSALGLNNLQTDLKRHEGQVSYLSNLLDEYVRNFDARLHVAERQRYQVQYDAAARAPEDHQLTRGEVYAAQVELLTVSIERLEQALGGERFQGKAVTSGGLVRPGTFLVLGPAVLFLSDDGQDVGTVDLRLGSVEPTVYPFADPEDAVAAARLVGSGSGLFPLDPTGGNAHKIEAVDETLIQHIKNGGTVMIPIFGMAGLALLVAIFKWLAMAFVRSPSRRREAALMEAVARQDQEAARSAVSEMKGPMGRMLAQGVEHMNEPRELIEEVMYETVLTTRLRLQRALPFIAICASSAPLLGLLGTVTGIIETFKLITIFGSGDVKMLSSGISKALITTEFGLIVAIPSLLIHAFLSRKARGVIGRMEVSAVTFMNQLGATSLGRAEPVPEQERAPAPAPLDAERMREQIREVLGELLLPAAKREAAGGEAQDLLSGGRRL